MNSTNTMTLYQMADQYKFLMQDLYDDESGLINESAMEELNNLTDSIDNKCINITRAFKAIDAKRKAIEIERKNMAAREVALKIQISRLKDYLLYNMEKCEIKKIECPQFVISLQKNPIALDTYDQSAIPKKYQKITIEYDDQKIKEDLKKGIDIPGARLIQRNSVRIK